ncbi:hypothetical protein DENSPDRAFT_855404 [Dentipellis sp. KUC8613]|nr:hypothetical protein DENSPDRAFT_855404 [Dentipellis sp. KUC8613]
MTRFPDAGGQQRARAGSSGHGQAAASTSRQQRARASSSELRVSSTSCSVITSISRGGSTYHTDVPWLRQREMPHRLDPLPAPASTSGRMRKSSIVVRGTAPQRQGVVERDRRTKIVHFPVRQRVFRNALTTDAETLLFTYLPHSSYLFAQQALKSNTTKEFWHLPYSLRAFDNTMQPMQMRANADLEDGVALEQGHIVEGFGLLVQLSLGTEVVPELQIDETKPAESTAGTAAVPCQTAEMSPSSSASAEEVEQMLIYGAEDQGGESEYNAHPDGLEHTAVLSVTGVSSAGTPPASLSHADIALVAADEVISMSADMSALRWAWVVSVDMDAELEFTLEYGARGEIGVKVTHNGSQIPHRVMRTANGSPLRVGSAKLDVRTLKDKTSGESSGPARHVRSSSVAKCTVGSEAGSMCGGASGGTPRHQELDDVLPTQGREPLQITNVYVAREVVVRPARASTMARKVELPVVLTALRVLDGHVVGRGVYGPTVEESVWRGVLEGLEERGVRAVEGRKRVGMESALEQGIELALCATR